MAPDNWSCPACALLDERGATHTYILDQPYERQDGRPMNRIKDTPDITDVHLEMSKDSDHAKCNSYQHKERLQPGSRARAGSIVNRSSFNKVHLGSRVSPHAVDFDAPLRNSPRAMNNTNSVEKASASLDTGSRLNPAYS
jgi:hypothetical protein